MCITNSDWKSGEAIKMETSQRRRGEVVPRSERLKTKFAIYLGLAKHKIKTRRLAGQTDEYSRSVCCWSGGIRQVAQPKA
jgi:hypothetical protein